MEDLTLRLAAGDQIAFKELVNEYQDKVYNTCLHFLRDTGEAEDITQEVFIEVYRSVGSFRGDSKLSTWIYRITTTKCLEYQRYKQRKRRFAFFRGLVGMEDAGQFLENNHIEYRHPGVELEHSERAEALYRAIDRLPESQREAFVLFNLEGFSYQEIADITNKSISSVESLIFRAKQNLRRQLENIYKN